MDNERRELLLGVLHRALGNDNPNADKFLDLAVKIRDLMETGTFEELMFLNGLLDGALAQIPEFIQKRRNKDAASGK